ncbi:hypothetical protein HMPREF9015_00647 [Leptotrichia wadei F0279]|uniref:Uncharacterized protein n=1 Tax=Leptotrichia wadei (strain F0279) TaxID=888055 RepID=U2Q9W5_LEPWF|nr:hypothetical protein HMPREF9015_00647 [Leptotrichia wadei F0279]
MLKSKNFLLKYLYFTYIISKIFTKNKINLFKTFIFSKIIGKIYKRKKFEKDRMG